MKKILKLGILSLSLLTGCQDRNNDNEIYSLSKTELRFLNQDNINNLKAENYDSKQAFIDKITTDLERQNKKKPFIKNFVKKYGFPDWEMVRWFESNDEIVAQIPIFIDDGNETQAVILAVEYNNKLKFRLIVRDKFEKNKKNKKPKPTVQKIKDLFIIFDFWKYGESSYLYEGQIVSEYDSSTHLKSTSEWGEACYLIQAVFVNGELIDARWDCETYYIWDVEMADPDEGGGDTSIWYEESAGTPSLPPVVIIDTTFSNTVANCVKIKLEN